MQQLTENAGDVKTTEIAKRLRAIGALADRLEQGADTRYVLDLAAAILVSGDHLDEAGGTSE